MWIAIWFAVAAGAGTLGYAAWAVHAVARGAAWWPFVVGFPFAYLAFPLFFTTLWMFFGWRWRSARPAAVELDFTGRARMFLHELASLAQAPKMIAYALLMRAPAPAPATLPVLLLHGIGCNAAVWTTLRRHLEAMGLGPVYALSYGPPFAPIETFAPQVAGKIARIERATGASQVVIVAHSMGGLVARSYLRAFGPAHVRRLVTIGTPHAGSRHAWLMSGASLAQMRPGSGYLRALETLDPNERAVPIVSIWSWHDSMVTPQTSSRLNDADIVLSGVAHNALLGDPQVLAIVADQVRKARDDGRTAAATPRATQPTSESPA